MFEIIEEYSYLVCIALLFSLTVLFVSGSLNLDQFVGGAMAIVVEIAVPLYVALIAIPVIGVPLAILDLAGG